MSTKDKAKLLAEIFYNELDFDSWGDIDPFLFNMIGQGLEDSDDDNSADAQALVEVLIKVIERFENKLK